MGKGSRLEATECHTNKRLAPTIFPPPQSGVPESDGVQNPTPLCGFSSASLALRRSAASSDATNGQWHYVCMGLMYGRGTPAGGWLFAHVPSTTRRLSGPTSVMLAENHRASSDRRHSAESSFGVW